MAYNFYPGFYPIQNNQQIQNSGFVSVRSVEEAFNYPVAPGNSITFKDENQPFVYTKTKGFSPLEQPVFERYRLVKVVEAPEQPQKQPDTAQEIKLLWDEVNALKRQITKGERHDKSADDNAVSNLYAEPGSVPATDEHSV